MDFSMLAGLMGPIQQAMGKAEAARTTARFEGKAGGGAVTVRITGLLQVEKMSISPAAAGDAGILEDLVTAALKDALAQYRNAFGGTPQEQMQKLVAGADLGALMGGLKR
jgi:DNA-binding protein YbaB